MSNEVLKTPGHLVSLAARNFAKLSENGLKRYGFSPGQLPVLVALKNGEARNQRELALFAKVEQAPMAQMLSRMERDNLIVKTTNANDARSIDIKLTDKAISRMPEAIQALLKGNELALQGFSDKEKASFISMLSRVITNLDELL